MGYQEPLQYRREDGCMWYLFREECNKKGSTLRCKRESNLRVLSGRT